ncbi:MAG TPA: M56 family metallopeptidase [Thermoanaerobaculia bacterium]|nr:M56 family metallopeptidase [Thermoanaerobaculia bacterium]
MNAWTLVQPLAPAMAGWLLTYLAHSTALLAAAWLASRFVVSADWRDTLWKAALVGSLVTASLPLPAHWRLPALPAASSTLTSVGTEPTAVARGAAELPSAALAGRAPGANSGQAERSAPPVPSRISGWPRPSAHLLAGLWAGVAAAGVLWRGLRYLLFLRRLDRRRVTDRQLLRVVEQLARSMRLPRPPRTTHSSALQVPIALAGGEVCLSDRFTALSPAQQRGILAHELAHLCRRDPLWLLAAELLRGAFFFQPLNRLAQRGLKEAAEQLCDDAAVAAVGDPLALAEGLRALAVDLLRRRPLPIAAVVDGRSPLVRRVARVLGPPGGPSAPLRWRVAIVAGACLLVGSLAPAAQRAPSTLASETGPAGTSQRADGEDLQVEYLDLELSHTGDDDRRGNPTRLLLRARGVRVPRGTAQIVGIDRDGFLEARQQRGGSTVQLRVDPRADGSQRRQLWVDDQPRPFDHLAEQWLAELLVVARFPAYYGTPPAPLWGVDAAEAEALSGAARLWNGEDQRSFERDSVPVTVEILARDVLLHPTEARVLSVRPGGALTVRERQGSLERRFELTTGSDGVSRIDSSCTFPEPVAESTDAWLARILRQHLARD